MSDKQRNLSVWDSFPKTDERYTKVSSVDGHSSTSISATYMVKLATDAFGPIGIGWGYEIVEERYDQTSPLQINGEFLLDNGNMIWGLTHTMRIKLWHSGSKENAVTQFGHTKYRYVTSKGKIMSDTEAPKKTLTDAMKKCLSLLGVCSDVFMGEFDDAEYRNLARLENDLKRADKNDEVYIDKVKELREAIELNIHEIKLCPTNEAAKLIWNRINRKVFQEAPLLGLDYNTEMQPVNDACNELSQKIEENNNA